eukprot:scaffold6933_cov178-Amphora_coffeaeformis.AAC.3
MNSSIDPPRPKLRKQNPVLIVAIVVSCILLCHQVATAVFQATHSIHDESRLLGFVTQTMTTTTSLQRVSPVCQPSWKRNLENNNTGPIRRIFFAHTRKAGGTTLTAFFRHVAKTYGWKFLSVEGKPAEPPIRSDTFYVTHLREPVARALSMYKYGGRWSCRKMVYPGQFPDYIPSPNNSRSLQDYLDKESNTPEQRQCLQIPMKRRKLWGCAKNCYLRWYGRDFNCLRDVMNSFQTAREKLFGYNLVVIMERMSDPSYVQGLLRMFGNLNTTILSKTQKMYCFDESRYWNEKYPAVISDAVLSNLTRLNDMDIRLYKELNDCPGGVLFPDFDPGYQVNTE